MTSTEKTEKPETVGSFVKFLLKLMIAVFIFRSFMFSAFNIPSESMLPNLANGDYLAAAKWPYGYSNYSVLFEAPIIPGRIFAGEPERGDIAVFKHPVDGTDYIKRVIALPGDTIAMENGVPVLNGKPFPREQIEDFIIHTSPNTNCAWGARQDQDADGADICRYTQFRETLPSGETYEVLDFGITPQDNFSAVIVPQDTVFLMGDNRDNSLDSRFPAEAQRGIGFVPQDNLFGRASIIMWSTDGSAEWLKPWTWFSAARSDRIGNGL